jgi:hypothetical protein
MASLAYPWAGGHSDLTRRVGYRRRCGKGSPGLPEKKNRRRGKEINDVLDEEKIQFRDDSGVHCLGDGIAARLGGTGPADRAELSQQRRQQRQQPDQPADAEPVGPVRFPTCAAAEHALAEQPRLHVAALDGAQPIGEPANEHALAAQDSDRPQHLLGRTRKLRFQSDAHAEPVAEHQPVRAGNAFDAQPLVYDSVSKRPGDPEAAFVQQAEPTEFAGIDHAGFSQPESVDPFGRSDSADRVAFLALDPESFAERADDTEY